MTVTEFFASRAPISDEIWDVLLQEAETDGLDRSQFFMYAGEYVLHEHDGKFFPHAWWYAPVAKDSLVEAESVLWEWRKEWV